MAVSTAPGQTAFTRIPFSASSSAATRVSPTMACLVAAYAPTYAIPVSPVKDAVFTIVPPCGLGDLGREGLDPEEHSDLVDLHDLHELRQRGVDERVEAQDAGVVDQPVDPPVRGLRGGDRRRPVGLLAHVQVDVVRADLLGELLPLVVEHVGDDHARALRREEPRLLFALPARGAGDEDDPPVQLAHALTP